MKSIQNLILSSFLFLLVGVGQIFGHAADPIGALGKYSIYGKDSVWVYNGTNTAPGDSLGGWLGSESLIRFNPGITDSKGPVYTNGTLKFLQPGFPNPVHSNGTPNNKFKKEVSSSVIVNKGAAVFVESPNTNSVAAVAFPSYNVNIGTEDCSIVGGLWECTGVSGGSNTLPPGIYGDITISGSQSARLTAGIYEFDNLTFIDNSKLLVDKSAGEFTRVFVKSAVTMTNQIFTDYPNAGDASGVGTNNYFGLIKSGGTVDSTQFGSILLFLEGTATTYLPNNSEFHFSFVAPNARIVAETATTLYGQLLAKSVVLHAGFEGAAGGYVGFDPSGVSLVGADLFAFEESPTNTAGNDEANLDTIPISLGVGTAEAASVNYSIETFNPSLPWLSVSDQTKRSADITNNLTGDIAYGINGAVAALSGRLDFSVGNTEPDTPLTLYVHDDLLAENDVDSLEYFILVLSTDNLSNLILEDDANAAYFNGTDTLIYLVPIKSEDAANILPTQIQTDKLSIDEGTTGPITLTATDPDGDDNNVSYSIVAGLDGALFEVNGSTLTLYDNAVFENATKDTADVSLQLTIRVQDEHVDQGTYDSTFTFIVSNSNDEKPTADIDLLTLDEGATNSIDVSANDLDSIDGLPLAKDYSLRGVDGEAKFGTASLTSAGLLSYVHDGSENFIDTIYYTLDDGGINPLTQFDTSFVVVTINSINENPPELTVDTLFVFESEVNGFAIDTLVATDEDNSSLTYSILSQEHENAFGLDSVTGALTVFDTDSVDHVIDSLHTLTVRVFDGANTLDVTFYIKVGLVNASSPVMRDTLFTINEDIVNLTVLGTLVATDGDDDILTFAIASQKYPDAFVLSPTGILSVNDSSKIDFEADSIHTIEVVVSDDSLSSNATVTVVLNNLNDNPPIYANAVFTIDEDFPQGDTVGTHQASDADNSPLTYDITSQTVPGAFTISNSGDITVLDSNLIDYESEIIHLLQVTVSDSKYSAQSVITINITNVNDIKPILDDIVYTIDEDEPVGFVLDTLTGSDLDGDLLEYSIISQSPGNAFALRDIGELRILDNTLIDYETAITHVISVQVSDGVYFDTAQVTVNLTNVNDNPLIFTDTIFSISEAALIGDTVGVKLGYDADGLDLTYSIVSQEISGAFNYDSNGVFVVNDNSTFDFDGNNTKLDVTVMVTDGIDSATAFISIFLTDVNDNLPTLNGDTISISEEVSIGSIVTTLVGNDGDKNDNLGYFIQSGNSNSDFIVDPVSGVLTVSNDLIYERDSIYDLVVYTSSNSDTTTASIRIIIINVNVKPVITLLDTLRIDENTLEGEIVTGQFTGEDADSTQVIWGLVDSTYFNIDSLTGQLTLKQDSTLNYETQGTIPITLTASDDYSTSYKSVSVYLGDVNDAPVIDNQVIQIKENQAPGTVIGTITSTDEDADAVIIYSLIDDSLFKIDSLTGELTVRYSTELDYEDQKTYFLDVIVSDGQYADTNKTIISLINVVEVATIEIVEIFDESGRTVKGVDEFFTSDDSVSIIYDKNGVLDTIKYSVEEGLNILKEKNDDETMDIHETARAEVSVSKVVPVLVIVIDSTVPLDSAENVYYINDIVNDSIVVQITYVNEKLETITFDSTITNGDFVEEGKERTKTIIYTDPFGNKSRINVNVILDTTPPELIIVTPEHKSKHKVLELDVMWITIDNDVRDTLNNVQLVSQGKYPITRSYSDFAGNSVTVTHVVTINADAAGALIELVDKVVEQKTEEEIIAYFEKKERDSDPGLENIILDKDGDGIPDIERANLNVILPIHNSSSVENLTAVEIGIQTSEGVVKRKNLTEFEYNPKRGLIGPTLELTLNFPINGGYSASDSLRQGYIPDSLRAACGQDSTMFKLKIEGIQFFIYDHIGQYVSQIRFNGFDLSDPNYQDDEGKVTLALELPQLKDGLKSEAGDNWGAGVYIMNGLIKTSATPRDCLSHINTLPTRRSSTTLLERVGYQRNND